MTILSTQIVPISKEYTIFMRFSTFFYHNDNVNYRSKSLLRVITGYL